MSRKRGGFGLCLVCWFLLILGRVAVSTTILTPSWFESYMSHLVFGCVDEVVYLECIQFTASLCAAGKLRLVGRRTRIDEISSVCKFTNRLWSWVIELGEVDR